VDRPKVKHAAARLPTNKIILGAYQWGIGAELADDAGGTVWRLLQLMDGTRDRAAIVADLGAERPDVDAASIAEAIDSLIAAGFVEDAGAPVPTELEPDELERYERNRRYFAWVDRTPQPSPWELQRRLKRSRVCVLGLGGAGSTVAASLAALGVGRLTCADFDTVGLSNLNRATFYTEQDIGHPKVDIAVSRLLAANRHVDVHGISAKVAGPDDIESLMDGHDLLVLCADTPQPDIKFWVNEAALRTGTPWQLCLYAGPMLLAGIFVPHRTACWACIPGADGAFRHVDSFEALSEEPNNAVIAPSAGMTGHLGALQAAYFLMGLRPQSVGRVFHQSLTRIDHVYFVEPLIDEACGVCGRLAGETVPRTDATAVAG
jgi:molybdopterin/thiamine biosynthesis adenylyltransferase